jgi:hemolysin activation/secretion protein
MLGATTALPAADVPTPGAVREQVQPAPAAPAARPAAPEVEMPKAKPSVAPGGAAILVNRFEITGNSVVSTADLQAQIAGYQGRKLTLAEIYGVADKLTDYYHKAGYTLAQVTVPAQQVSSGTIKLEVLEGRVGAIRFTGNKRYRAELLDDHVTHVAPGRVLTIKGLEDDLLDLNSLPGLSARAVVQPGATYGTTDVMVKTVETPYTLGVSLDNYGRTIIGEWRLQGNATINNPLGYGDRLDFNVLHSEGGLLEYGRFNYDAPLNHWGTHANVYYSRYNYKVDTGELGTAFAGVDISGEGDDFGINLTQPFIRNRVDTLYGAIGFERTLTRQRGLLKKANDIGLLRLNMFYTHVYANDAVSTLNAEVSTNFRGNKDGTQNNRQAGKLRIDATHLQPLKYSWSLFLRASGVASIDPLVDTERFRIGGPTGVRAFPSAELAGDEGMDGTIEFRRPLAWIPGVPLQGRIFYDAGMVYRKKPAAGEHDTESLTGFGFGLTGRIARNYAFDVAVVQPTTAYHSTDGRDTRAWFSFSAAF